MGCGWGLECMSMAEEKLGGRPFIIEDSFNFISRLKNCDLQDSVFLDPLFTWSDNRYPPNTIWKRLNMLVCNANWFD